MTPEQVLMLLGSPYQIESVKGSRTHQVATCRNSTEAERSISVTDTTNISTFFQHIAADTAVHACDAADERKNDRHTTFTYSRHGGLLRPFPMLWVHFDKQALVDNVYAKEYTVYDDHCIYSLSSDISQNMRDQTALKRLFRID